jgi:hypothetical protein
MKTSVETNYVDLQKRYEVRTVNITRAGELRRLLTDFLWPLTKDGEYTPGQMNHAQAVALLVIAECFVELAACVNVGALAVATYDPNAQ